MQLPSDLPRTSGASIQTLAEALPHIVWTADARGDVNYFNRRWTEYTGLTIAQTRRHGWERVLHPDDRPVIIRRWREAVRIGESYEIEYRFRRASDGTYRWHLGRALLVAAGAEAPVTWLGTCTDIEDVKRLQVELQEAVHLRENFVSVASHELRTPLTALRLQLALLQRALARHENIESSVLHRQVARLSAQEARLSRLVDSLLDVSRLTAGKLQLQLDEVNLVTVARDVVDRVREEASQAGCVIDLVALEPVVGEWDALRLEQVLTNLLANAMKYGAGRPIEVVVIRHGSTAELRVRDHGIGIDPSQHGRIFERFERIAATSHFGGFGLGLWIAREIVQALGGSIRVESTLGDGACFAVLLPIRSGHRVRLDTAINDALDGAPT